MEDEEEGCVDHTEQMMKSILAQFSSLVNVDVFPNLFMSSDCRSTSLCTRANQT